MRKGFPLALLALGALCACAGRRTHPGAYKDGYGVEVSAPTVAEARRAAVSQFLDLYVSSPPASTAALDADVLGKAETFIVREKSWKKADGVELRAVVQYFKLAAALDKLGLVRPEGVSGKPKVLVGLREKGPGTGRDLGDASAGRASDTLRRRLTERGYTVRDNSDVLMGGTQRAGSREESLAAGRKMGAEVTVAGEAEAASVPDERLAGYGNCRAVVRAQALSPDGERIHASVDQEATAVDIGVPAACAKALENAGELAADRIAAALAESFKERAQFTAIFGGLGGLEQARKLLAAVRGLPRVAGAHFESANGKTVRAKIYAEKMGADDLAAELLHLREFNLQVRQVDPDFNVIEFGDEAGY